MPRGEDERAGALGTPPESAYRRALRAELERRIGALGATSDDAFGRLGMVDAVAIAVLGVLVPAVLVWLFA